MIDVPALAIEKPARFIFADPEDTILETLPVDDKVKLLAVLISDPFTGIVPDATRVKLLSAFITVPEHGIDPEDTTVALLNVLARLPVIIEVPAADNDTFPRVPIKTPVGPFDT